MPDKKVVVLFDSKVDRLDGIYLVAEELGFKPIMLITNEFDHKHESVPERVKRYKTFKSRFYCILGYADVNRASYEKDTGYEDELINELHGASDVIFVNSSCITHNDFADNNERLYKYLASNNIRLHLILETNSIDAKNIGVVHLRTIKNVVKYDSVAFYHYKWLDAFNGSQKYTNDIDADFKKFTYTLLSDMLLGILLLDNASEKNINVFDYSDNKYVLYKLLPKDLNENYKPDEARSLAYSSKLNYEEAISPVNNKNTCKLLKKLRDDFAHKHNVVNNEEKCKNTGFCRGTCYACDRQAKELFSKAYGTREKTFYLPLIKGNIRGISRLRVDADGNGVRSLIVMDGCNLKCKCCINKGILSQLPVQYHMEPTELRNLLFKDMLYFEMTGGGVTFGGGEPLLQADFISEFHRQYPEIDVAIETALNVPRENVERLSDFVSQWFIDIKDIDSTIYSNYTGNSNDYVLANLHMLSKKRLYDKICIRIPRINGFNNDDNVRKSVSYIKNLGFNNINVFEYEVN